jgi:hypothetical protein
MRVWREWRSFLDFERVYGACWCLMVMFISSVPRSVQPKHLRMNDNISMYEYEMSAKHQDE